MGSGGYKTKSQHAGPAGSTWNGKTETVKRTRPKNAFLRAVDDAYDQQDYDRVQELKEAQANARRAPNSAAALLAALTRRPNAETDASSGMDNVSAPLDRKRAELEELREQEATLARIMEVEKSEGADYSGTLAELDEVQSKIRDLEFDLHRLNLISRERRGEQISEAEKYSFGLDDSVEVWSDFCKVNIHPKSLCIVDAFDHDLDSFDLWSQGAIAIDSNTLEDFFDGNLRYFAEECDYLRGFQVLTDATNGWGGVCDIFLEDLKQEFGKKSLIAFGDVQQPVPPASKEVMETNFNLANSYHSSVERALLNTSLSILNIRSKCDVFVPYSYSHLGASDTALPLLSSFDVKKRFHTSALIATAFDSATMPYRLVDTGFGISSFANTLAPVKSLNVSSMALCAPLPLQALAGKQDTYLMDVLTKDSPIYRAPFMKSLLGGMSDPNLETHKTPFAETAFLRGVPESARQARSRREGESVPTITLLMQYMSIYSCRHRSYMAMDEGSPAPISFPRFFSPQLTSTGLVGSTTKDDDANKSTLVRSFPSLTHVQATTHLREWFRRMNRDTAKLDWPRLASLYAEGTSPVDRAKMDEISNEYLTLMEDYEWHG